MSPPRDTGRRTDDDAPPSAPIDFDEFACADALGVLLAHTLNVGAHKLRKGHRIDANDIARLEAAGVARVTGARLGPNCLAENEAAALVAALLAGANLAPRRAAAGRCNLHATVDGLLCIDAGRVIRANGIDESVVIGTLPPGAMVRRGQVVATVKIIPFGVAANVLRTLRATLSRAALDVAVFRPLRTALIFTELPNMPPGAIDAVRNVTRQRLEAMGSRLALELRCHHTAPDTASALRQAHAAGCELIMICGAAGTKDRRDTVASGIVAAGGRIDRFGMPVEPGNMLLLGHLEQVPLLVLPGCARSRRLNGLDWVLRRLLAGLPLDSADFAAMGVGGLIRSTTEPTEDNEDNDDNDATGTPDASSPPHAAGPRIAALVLAAGRSSRMGGPHKLLECVDGVPLILRAVNAARASRATSVTIVTGHAAEDVETLVARSGAHIVRNPDYAEGMSTSLRRGLATLPADSDGVLVLLADMPHISATHLDALIGTFAASLAHRRHPPIVVPVQAGQRGNPVLWPRRYFAEMTTLEGDRGARDLLTRHAAEIVAVDLPGTAAFLDIDTPEDMRQTHQMRQT